VTIAVALAIVPADSYTALPTMGGDKMAQYVAYSEGGGGGRNGGFYGSG
jgi:hypothetical protein